MIRKIFFTDDALSNNSKVGFFAAGIIFTALRIVGDVILFMIGKYNLENLLLWNTITSSIIIFSFMMTLFMENSQKKKGDNNNFSVDYLKDVNKFFLISISILFAGIFIEAITNVGRIPENLFTLFSQIAFSLFVLIATIYVIHYLYKWFNIRKHKRTKFYLFIIAYIYSFFIIKEFMQFHLGYKLEFLDVFGIIVYISLVVLSWLLNSKNSWVTLLPRDLKVKQAWLSFFTFIIAIVVMSRFADLSDFNIIILKYFPFSRTIIIITFIILSTSMLRIFFLILASLPTSTIVERRTSEISSLTYLNKLVADSLDYNIDNLFDVVTKLALQSCNANSSWTELYEGNTVRIVKSININENAVYAAHNDFDLTGMLCKFQQSELIDSVVESKYFSAMKNYLPNVKSLIIIPLFSSTDRIGTLLVGDTEEYSFEIDDLKVLNAFGDNIRIALENAKLVKASIEKERYKNELLVAQKIQSKLLPSILPEIENYSISAYSIPATEVGGDYYDIVKLKNGNYCILVGDVSGKGFSAAFYMAQLKGIVMSVAASANSPSELLRKINKILYGNIEKKLYITMSALSIVDNQGNISFARAGHMPFLIKQNNKISSSIPNGIGLGLANESIFDNALEEVSLKLNENDAVLMFTDGINEMQSEDKEEFGYEPLKNTLSDNKNNNAIEVTENIIKKVQQYGDNLIHSDDMTIFALIFLGNKKLME